MKNNVSVGLLVLGVWAGPLFGQSSRLPPPMIRASGVVNTGQVPGLPGAGQAPGLPGTMPGAMPASPAQPPRPLPLPETARQAAPSVPVADTGLPRPENLTAFDPLAVEIKWDGSRVTLQAGGKVLKDFGTGAEEARQAWHLIREMGLNQHATIGGPRPVLEYWLKDGQPPHTLPGGVRVLPLDPSGLRLEQTQGFWVLRERARTLFNFGTNADDARQALAVLQKYGFNQAGLVGRAAPSMLVLVTREGTLRRVSTPEAPTGRAPGGLKQAAGPGSPAEGSQPPGGLASKPVLPTYYPAAAVPPLKTGELPVTNLAQHQHSFLPSTVPGRFPGAVETANALDERVPFDWRQVRVQRDVSGTWKLVAGGHTLANFGASERDARMAHAAVVHYRLSEEHRVGGPEPVARYFLSDGQAPLGMMPGVMNESFRPEALSVHQVGARYYLSQGSHPVLDCGTRPDEAKHLLEVVKQNHFDHLYRIGPDDQHALSFFVRGY